MKLKEKKILVTGADGFIGSHLVERLLELNCDIRAFVYYNSFNSFGWLDTLPAKSLKEIEIFAGDIRDPNGVRKAVRDCDIVLHLASLIAIPYSYHSPDSYIDTNIKGALNILNASRDYNIERTIITSTSEVYGSARYVPINEEHPLQGQSPYSASKIGADQLALSFYRSFELPLAIIRPFNTYGPRQSARAIIPTIITQALNGMKQIEIGSVFPTRDFTYVKDTVEGFIKMAEHYDVLGEVINVGSNYEISIEKLIEVIKDKLNMDITYKIADNRKRPAKSEVDRLWCDNSKATRILEWENKISLEEGIQLTVDWFRKDENLIKYKSDRYNL